MNAPRALCIAKASVRIGAIGCFLLLSLTTAVCTLAKFTPAMPGPGHDSSWCFGMNQAVAQRLAFGRDLIFTFGPYSSLLTGNYHPATDTLMLWGSLFFAISFGLATFLNFRDSKWHLQLMLLLAMTGLIAACDLPLYYPLLIGVYVFRFDPPASEVGAKVLLGRMLLISLFAPCGLLPLIKGTFLFPCIAIVAFSILLLALRKDWKSAAIVGISPLVVLPLFWIISGQSLTSLPSYFIAMLPIISGYSEAMSIDGATAEAVVYGIAAIIVLIAVLREARTSVGERVILALMFAVVLLMGFKEGFVRHDAHALRSGAIILLASLLLCSFCDLRRTLIVLCISFFVWMYIDSDYVQTNTAGFLNRVVSTYQNAWDGLTLRISNPQKLPNDFRDATARLNAEKSFPVLRGTTDIYSYHQSYLISSGNIWNPRPVLQSYSAYTPALVEKNRLHLLGANAPDNLIFAVQPIDGRVPSLEDGASWPVILSHYEIAGTKNGYLLLSRCANCREPVESAVSTEKHSSGDVVKLPEGSLPLFARVRITQSLLGRVVSVLFKPSNVTILINMEDGSQKSYRVIPGMATTGFLLSPLVENTNDFGLLYAGASYLKGKKVKSFTVDTKESRLWNKEFEVDFAALDLPAHPEVARLFQPEPPGPQAASSRNGEVTTK